MKAYRDSGSTAPLILNICTRGRSVVNFVSRPLHPHRNNPRKLYLIGGWVGPEPVWTFGEEENILPMPGFETRIYIIIIRDKITNFSTNTLGNLHLSQIVGEIRLSQVREIHPIL
jgi:hypothetical protein